MLKDLFLVLKVMAVTSKDLVIAQSQIIALDPHQNQVDSLVHAVQEDQA